MLVVLGALGIVTLVMTAFGSPSAPPAPLLPTSSALALAASQPRPEKVATVSNLGIQLPVAQETVTAIGFHGSTTGGLALHPLGRQINEGLLARLWHKISGSPRDARAWYQLDGGDGPSTAVLDVGAPPDTDVYSPVDGTITSISDTIVDGRKHGVRIDIRPTASPSVIVSVMHVNPDPALALGSAVLAASTKLGTVANIASVERQALAEHTNDNGDNVAIEVHPAPTQLP